jgi:hypothetical protein
MRENPIGEFLKSFVRTTLALWGFFVPAVAAQYYLHGRISVAAPDFINPAMIACGLVVAGAALIAFSRAFGHSGDGDTKGL